VDKYPNYKRDGVEGKHRVYEALMRNKVRPTRSEFSRVPMKRQRLRSRNLDQSTAEADLLTKSGSIDPIPSSKHYFYEWDSLIMDYFEMNL
jgi:hypothetical protein